MTNFNFYDFENFKFTENFLNRKFEENSLIFNNEKYTRPKAIPKGSFLKMCVVDVVDGDTISVMQVNDEKYEDLIGENGERLVDYRLFRMRVCGIDSPEMGRNGKEDQPYAQMAKDYMSHLVFKKIVAVQFLHIDRFGRILGLLYLEDGDQYKIINLYMVRAGLAFIYGGRDPFYGVDPGIFEQTLRLAKEEKLNIFSQDTIILPSEGKKHSGTIGMEKDSDEEDE
ncbi:hypothetical protein EHP00_1226 [Ecytonucleospora hepatopenaei]|uniref:TNase-like domain-containing protein n=1 Tax=Ecytonucleospora hepatopenaei TaxID=646526 RepID=A0A1W0E8A3_9MICR|nr:hypothetical protein EHP00_1226 [Ecytonucleospora hepatopenaei]